MNVKEYYWTQKHHAKDRGIEWQFTFDSWLAWWGDDIVNRGRNPGQLVMARNGDQGPYHPDNCSKKTMEENIREGQIGNSNGAKIIKTPKGIFNSRKEAAKAYGVNVGTIGKRLNKYPEEYHYLQD